jgi:hypothetical protein
MRTFFTISCRLPPLGTFRNFRFCNSLRNEPIFLWTTWWNVLVLRKPS